MAFGHASLPTRKYAYGVREYLPGPRPTSPDGTKLPRVRFDGHDAALNQLLLAHRFQNKLIELERARRDRSQAALLAAFPDLAQLLADAESSSTTLAELRDQLTAANIVAESRVSDRDLARRIKAQSQVSTAAWRAYSSARREAYSDPAVRTTLNDIDADCNTASSAARNDAVTAGLYWATTLQVASRVKKSGPPPRFQRWDGEGVISIQFQRKPDRTSPKIPVLDSKGQPRISPRSGRPMTAHATGTSLTTESLFTPNSLLWIERSVAQAPFSPNEKHVTVHFRIGSAPDGSPIWAKLPTTLHRPFPEGAQVKWAHLSRRRIGTHFKYEVLFDIAKPEWDDHPAGAERAESGTVAVALGWRRIDGEIRAGEWVGSDGVTGSIRIPDWYVEQFNRLASLQGIRDRNFDRDHAALCEWVLTQDLPIRFRHRTATLRQWNSPRRLAALVLWWRSHRVSGDDEIFTQMEGSLIRNSPARDYYTGGRKQDKHLADWTANLRAKTIAFRKDFYRKIAIDLSYQYKSVITAEIDWHAIAENPEPEDAADLVNKTFRGLSACATLRDCLTEYMEPIGAASEGITITCHICGGRMPPPGRGRWVSCERCGGEPMDRAVNAANNLLRRGLGAEVGGATSRG